MVMIFDETPSLIGPGRIGVVDPGKLARNLRES